MHWHNIQVCSWITPPTHITPLLCEQHWLPFCFQVQLKMQITYKVLYVMGLDNLRACNIPGYIYPSLQIWQKGCIMNPFRQALSLTAITAPFSAILVYTSLKIQTLKWTHRNNENNTTKPWVSWIYYDHVTKISSIFLWLLSTLPHLTV